VRVSLVCDDKPRKRGGDDRGYGLPLVTTDLESSAEDLVARYAARWGIEQAFADARQIIGVGEGPQSDTSRRGTDRAVRVDLFVACQRDGTTALPRPRDHLGVDVMVIGSPPRVNQDTPVAAGWRVWPGRWRRR
jgi:hypothetical protein